MDVSWQQPFVCLLDFGFLCCNIVKICKNQSMCTCWQTWCSSGRRANGENNTRCLVTNWYLKIRWDTLCNNLYTFNVTKVGGMWIAWGVELDIHSWKYGEKNYKTGCTYSLKIQVFFLWSCRVWTLVQFHMIWRQNTKGVQGMI